MAKHIDTLRSVIHAWRRLDIDGVLSHVHDDLIWNNSGGLNPPLIGKAAMRETLEEFASITKEGKQRLFAWAEVGDTVWMEGVEEIIANDGRHIAIPYAGILDFEDGLIKNWREYFEGRILEDMMEGGEMSPEVAALIDRPEV